MVANNRPTPNRTVDNNGIASKLGNSQVSNPMPHRPWLTHTVPVAALKLATSSSMDKVKLDSSTA
jgi:hypothetical protein